MKTIVAEKENLNIESIKNLPRKFIFLAVLIFAGLVLTLIFCDTLIFDELEHLRASYFVSQGEVPYRDFFEHHHPLLWFMFAPLISVLPHSSITALYTAKTVAFLFSCASVFIIYKMAKRFFGGTFGAVISLCCCFFYFAAWYGFSVFKPDTFMRFFYLAGLYQFFVWHENGKVKNLIVCGVCFTVAFLFLQTAVFSILPLFFPLVYVLYRNPAKIKQVAVALPLPAAIMTAAVLLLYSGNALKPYFELNWIYNRYLFDILYSDSGSLLLYFGLLIFTAAVLLIRLYSTGQANFYLHVLALLFVCELIQHIVFPAVYPHYLLLLFIFSALITGYALSFCRSRRILNMVFAVLLLDTVLNFGYIFITVNSVSHKYLREYDRNPDSGAVSFDVTCFSVFAPKYSYYWFYPDLEYVDNALFHRLPDYDINEIIRSAKPEYIAYSAEVQRVFDFRRPQAAGFTLYDCRSRHTLQPELLSGYEKVLPHLYKRKSE